MTTTKPSPQPQLQARVAPARTRRPAVTAGGQLAVALLLHLALALAFARVAGSAVGSAIGDPLLPVAGGGELLGGWFVHTVAPAAAWVVLVLGRSLLHRATSGFWFTGAAMLVAGGSFTVALVLGAASAPGIVVGTVLAAWLLVPCAAAVALGAHLRARGTGSG